MPSEPAKVITTATMMTEETAAAPDTVCSVCFEQYNRTTRAAISCVKCDFECCKTCFRRYISDPETALRCMQCRVEFDRTGLYTRLGAAFMRTTYRDIREAVLYEAEKTKFPATQELIERELEIARLRQERKRLEEKYSSIRRERTSPLLEFRHSGDTGASVRDVLDEYFSLLSSVEAVDEQMQEERSAIAQRIDELKDRSVRIKRTYVLACTSADCKGMLSKENRTEAGHYLCSICVGVTCGECAMPIPADGESPSPPADGASGSHRHRCDPDVLETIRLVESTSKPCPACGVPIHKLSGCAQMFCTSCHASFDWRTMRLNDGAATHNPYHSAWLRENQRRGRELGDLQCGRELTIDLGLDLVAVFEDAIEREALAASGDGGRSPMTVRKLPPSFTLAQLADQRRRRSQQRPPTDAAASAMTPLEASAFLFESIRVAIHHQEVTLPALTRARPESDGNQQLRVSLLWKSITEAEFKHEIQRRDKAASRRTELLQIVVTYRDSLTDIIWRFMPSIARSPRGLHWGAEELCPVVDWMNMVAEIRALILYVDECFLTVKKVYGSSTAFSIMGDQSV